MIDRAALAAELVTARQMSVATLPADEDEPEAGSRWWAIAVAGAAWRAARARDPIERRDLVVLVGAHVLGWLEAFQAARSKA